jgi:hypothetical protein
MKKPYLIVLCFYLLLGRLHAQAPVIRSFAPTSGPAGTLVTINGANFNPSVSNNIVLFGGIKAVVSSASATAIQVKVPAGIAYQPISVLNVTNHLSGSSGNPFNTTLNTTHKIYASQFNSAVHPMPGITPHTVNLADLDQDGKLDIIVWNYNGESISVYKNKSVNGGVNENSFADKTDLSLANDAPLWVTTADVDGDGKPDIIAGARIGFAIFRNTSTAGNVSFATPISIAAKSPTMILATDIDSDGKIDIVDFFIDAGKSNVTVYKNTMTNGIINSASFASKTNLVSNSAASSLCISDIDVDGKPDLVLLTNDTFNATGIITLMHNVSTNANINYDAKIDFTTGAMPAHIVAADFDGDGKPDLAVTCSEKNNVAVHYNTSKNGAFTSGTLAPEVDFITTAKPWAISVADVDSDGKPDILTTSYNGSSLSMLRNKSVTGSITQASFDTRIDLSLLGIMALTIINDIGTGDIDGDGRPDMVLLTDSVFVLRNNPYRVPVISSISPSHTNVEASITITGSEFNSTAAKDIVYFGAVRAKVSNATATQLNVVVPVGSAYGQVSVCDAGTNLTAYSPFPFIPTTISKRTITGADFDAPVELAKVPYPYATGISYADLDGDGKIDMAIANHDSGHSILSVYLNTSVKGSISATSFAPPVNITVGNDNSTVTIRDFNGDGKPDLLVYNNFDKTVSFLKNNTLPGKIDASSFAPLQSSGIQASSFELADMDGDGKPDLITPTSSIVPPYTLKIYRNVSWNTKLSVDRPQEFETAATSNVIAVGDLDGDRKPDVVLGNVDNSISIFRNVTVNQTIAMAARINIPVTNISVSDIKIVDINGDGKPDLVLNYNNNTRYNSIISVMLNISTQGTITSSSFGPLTNFAVGMGAGNLAITDMNGDGKPDLVIDNTSGVSVMLNNSNLSVASFGTKADLTAGLSGRLIDIFDIDGDGKADIVFYDGILRATRFNPKPDVTAPLAPGNVTLGTDTGRVGSSLVINGSNFNGTVAGNIVYVGAVKAKVLKASSAQLTVEVPKSTSYSTVSVLNTSNNLSGSSGLQFVNTFKSVGTIDAAAFKRQTPPYGSYDGNMAVVFGDLDGDGKPDMVFGSHSGGDGRVTIYANTTAAPGDGFTFQPALVYPTYTTIRNVRLADVDGDGKLDIIVSYIYSDSKSFSVFRNSSKAGTISFETRLDIGSANADLDIADLNGDGKPDVAIIGGSFNNDQVYIYQNTSVPGKISFTAAAAFASTDISDASTVTLSDIDGDHRPDMVIASSSSAIRVFNNVSANGGFSFAAPVVLTVNKGATAVKIGDIDGDGKPDIVMAITEDDYTSKNIGVLLNTSLQGKISFKNRVDFAGGNDIQALGLGDINGDGKPDAVIVDSSGGKVIILQNSSVKGKVSFSGKTGFDIIVGAGVLAVGDLDGDSKPDLAVAYEGGYYLALLQNDMQSVPQPVITANGPLNVTDGKILVLTANPGNGYSYRWARDGVEIKNAVTATLTITQIGSYTVSITADGITKTSEAALVTLPDDNFKLAATALTCKGNNTGSITITAKQKLNYTATISSTYINHSYPFTTIQKLDNLNAGTYNVCITVDGQPDYQQCFSLIVNEPKDLAVYSTVDNKNNLVTLQMAGGDSYNVQLNGNIYTTSLSQITLALSKGRNDLMVGTGKDCQGIINKIIMVDATVVYPVPFTNILMIDQGIQASAQQHINIYNMAGKKIYDADVISNGGKIKLDVSSFEQGGYILRIAGNDTAYKIWK